MKKLFAASVVCVLLMMGCTEQQRAMKFGGNMNLMLPAGKKLVNVTWKEGNNLWVLTRNWQPGDTAIYYEFTETSAFGILQGTVQITEVKP